MNRLELVFDEKKKNRLSIFMTAGYPEKNSLLEWVPILEKEGVDFIEVGIPFSDPIADGQTIQESSAVAIENGMNLSLIFKQIAVIRRTSNLPIVLMGYLNPIIAYGMAAFLDQCVATGINGLIIPDLPVDAYQRDYIELFENRKMALVFLVTPLTDKARLLQISKLSHPFIYYMSTASTTGKAHDYTNEEILEFQQFKQSYPNLKIMLGFGIHNQRNFEIANQYFYGAIIGSAFIREQPNKEDAIAFIRDLSSQSSE